MHEIRIKNDMTTAYKCTSLKYLGVYLMMCDRIRKFNTSAYDVLLKSADLTEVVRCELIVKKCLHIHLVLVGLI